MKLFPFFLLFFIATFNFLLAQEYTLDDFKKISQKHIEKLLYQEMTNTSSETNQLSKEVSKRPTAFLFLNNLTTLSAAQAKVIAKFEGDFLYLNGLAELNKETAIELAKFNGKEIFINGLETIYPEAAAEIVQFKGVLQNDLQIRDWVRSLKFEGIANKAFDEEDFPKAIDFYTKAIEADRSFEQYDVYQSRAESYYLNQQFKEAIEDFNKILKAEPDEVKNREDIYQLRGAAFVELKEYSKAIEDYEKAIEIKPNDMTLYEEKAEIYFAQGRQKEGLRLWQKIYEKRLHHYRKQPFLRSVQVEFLTREKLKTYIIDSFFDDYPDEKIIADQKAYAHFGLIPKKFNLKKCFVELLTEQIAGFFDPKTKKFYLIEEMYFSNENKLFSTLTNLFNQLQQFGQQQTLVHELTHALADQHFDLLSMMKSVEKDDDMALAYSALLEGEAVLTMFMDIYYDSETSIPDLINKASKEKMEAPTFEDNLKSVIGFDTAMGRTPPIIKDLLMFPYTKGYDFCCYFAKIDQWKTINKAFKYPPLSTEQILHPEKYATKTRDNPVTFFSKAPFPLDKNKWNLIKENTLGEYQTWFFFKTCLDEKQANKAASGWDGDRYFVLESKNSNNTSLIWTSVWDSDEDATEFVQALNKACRVSKKQEVFPVKEISKPISFWKNKQGFSGVWKKGARSLLINNVPLEEFPKIISWFFQLETKEKQIPPKIFVPKIDVPKKIK